MLTADQIPSTRRALIGGAVALPALASPDRWADHPDRELIRLSERLTAIWAMEAGVNHDDPAEEEAYYRQAHLVLNPLIQRRAHTLDGLRAKARAVAWSVGADLEELMANDDLVTFERAALSIVLDLLRAT